MTFIEDKLRALQPLSIAALVSTTSSTAIETAQASDWEAVVKALGRIGKQQLRANQETELLVEELRSALAQAKSVQESLSEQADVYRRRTLDLEADARRTRETALSILDALDDLAVVARQKNDVQWTSRVERLTARTLDAFSEMGLTEVPAEGALLDEHSHEVADSVDRGTREPFQIVEVLRRGFRFQGSVLRRAQVITTRGG